MLGKLSPLIALMGREVTGFSAHRNIQLEPTFPRTNRPTVVAALSGFSRGPLVDDDAGYVLKVSARDFNPSNFNLAYLAREVKMRRLEISWIACA